MNLNRITLCGFTGRDAKTSATQSGRNISRLSIATTKRYKDANDEWQERTQWHSCIAFGSTADYTVSAGLKRPRFARSCGQNRSQKKVNFNLGAH